MITKFSFGNNWLRFLRRLSSSQISHAKESLYEAVGNLQGKTFVDVGCGSGLMSLAAVNLHAKHVLAFDADTDAVNCVLSLREDFCPSVFLIRPNIRWHVARGDILNHDDLLRLEERFGWHDVVYAWGVLHHTGNMKQAMENIIQLVAPSGLLFLSIYNDQGGASKRWLKVKQLYNSSWLGRWTMLPLVFLYLESRHALRRLLRGQNPLPFNEWRQKQTDRGMSVICDLVDWVGGLPFEVAKPEEIIHFYQERDFRLVRLKTCAGGHGCNEFLFTRENSH